MALTLALALAPPAAAQSRRGELRGAWMPEGYQRDWPAIMAALRENGFNAVFPNFSIGNMALYPSKTLAVVPGGDPGRDELAEAASAAKANGIELHVWRINWALWSTPPELLDQLDAAGRLQRNSRGERGRDDPHVGVDWLCPSHPDNRKLEADAMLELVRSYDIAGVHFDYMRFPGAGYCFCDGCRERFQRDTAVRVDRWPDDVLRGGPHAERWRQWRRLLQTTLVREISDQAYRIKPDVFVSLAAWADLDHANRAVAQEWPAWVREGLLDFVCPMDYTLDQADLSAKLDAQLGATRSQVPLYAGLGAFLMESPDDLIQQVEIARDRGADGFVAFAYGSGKLAEWLPDLRATVTADAPGPTPHSGPSARFAFSGPAISDELREGEAIAGSRLEVQIRLGWIPPSRDPSQEESEGAAQAAAMMRRATESRGPVTSYEQTPELIPRSGDEERISGRILVETSSGLSLFPLGVFDSDSQVERAVGFSAPEGAFRVAIYGSRRIASRSLGEFVVRSPVVRGIPADEIENRAKRAELDKLWAQARELLASEPASHLRGTLQVQAIGPGGGLWWFRMEDGKCESGPGAIAQPDAVITGSVEDYLAIARGESDPRTLWDKGRLHTSGDLALLHDIADLLDHTSSPAPATPSP